MSIEKFIKNKKYKMYIPLPDQMPTILEGDNKDIIIENKEIVEGFDLDKIIFDKYKRIYDSYTTIVNNSNLRQEIKDILIMAQGVWTRHQTLMTNSIYNKMSLPKKIFLLKYHTPNFQLKYVTVVYYMLYKNLYSEHALLKALNIYINKCMSYTDIKLSMWIKFQTDYVQFLHEEMPNFNIRFFNKNILEKTKLIIKSQTYIEYYVFDFIKNIKNIQNKFLKKNFNIDLKTINHFDTIYENNIIDIKKNINNHHIRLNLLTAEAIFRNHQILSTNHIYKTKTYKYKSKLLNEDANNFINVYPSISSHIIISCIYSKKAFTSVLNYSTK